jgi:hypothetical protein
MVGLGLAIAGAVVVGGAGARWFQLLRAVRIPQDRTTFLVATGIGALLGIAAFLAGVGLVGGLLAGFAILGGVGFVALWAASGQSRLPPAVTVGEPLLAFTGTDDEGRPFDVGAFAGKPLLLKFFRGHW